MLYNAKNSNLFCIFYLFVTKHMSDLYCMKFTVKIQKKTLNILKIKKALFWKISIIWAFISQITSTPTSIKYQFYEHHLEEPRRHNVKLNPSGGALVVNILIFDLRVQLQHCTHQRKTFHFALIKVSTFICEREIPGFSSPLMCSAYEIKFSQFFLFDNQI